MLAVNWKIRSTTVQQNAKCWKLYMPIFTWFLIGQSVTNRRTVLYIASGRDNIYMKCIYIFRPFANAFFKKVSISTYSVYRMIKRINKYTYSEGTCILVLPSCKFSFHFDTKYTNRSCVCNLFLKRRKQKNTIRNSLVISNI